MEAPKPTFTAAQRSSEIAVLGNIEAGLRLRSRQITHGCSCRIVRFWTSEPSIQAEVECFASLAVHAQGSLQLEMSELAADLISMVAVRCGPAARVGPWTLEILKPLSAVDAHRGTPCPCSLTGLGHWTRCAQSGCCDNVHEYCVLGHPSRQQSTWRDFAHGQNSRYLRRRLGTAQGCLGARIMD